MHTLHSNYGTVYYAASFYVSTVKTLRPTGCSKCCAYIHLYNHTLTNLRRFYTPGMIGGLDDYFTQLCTSWRRDIEAKNT